MLSWATLSRLLAATLAGAALGAPLAARADGLSAVATQGALARGATAWDVRAGPATLIAGAVQASTADVQRWLDGQGTQWLERAVSTAGIDLSRDVVVYGAAGDPRAQALYEGLTRLASGRVHWLVGGIDEWQAAGLPTAGQAVQRLPVPQRLVPRALADGLQAPTMAAPALRRSEPAQPVLAVTATSPRG